MSRGRSVSKKRSIKGKRKHDANLRQPCKYYLKGTGILPNVNSLKTNRDVKHGKSACSRITRLKNNRVKSRERATIHQKRRESDDKNSVALVKIVSQLGCVSQNSDALDSRKKSWDQFEENDSRSLRYVRQVSGKRKDHRLEKYKSRIFIREVPTQWNLRTDPMKTLKDNSDAPEARHGILPKTCTSSKRRDKLNCSRAEEWVLPAASTKELEERGSL